MTNPGHFTCPKWAAKEARRQALEEAAKMALLYVRLMEQHAMKHDAFAALIADGGIDEQILALIDKE